MVKYAFRLICVLTIVFIAVPFFVSLGSEHSYLLPLDRNDRVTLEMPDGERTLVSTDEFFIGAAAAFLPADADEDSLRAAYVMLNTPELTACGIYYLSPDERTALWGDEYEEKSLLYSEVLETVQGQSILVPSNTDISLFECMKNLENCQGDYTCKLAALFPGGGLKTEK